MTRNLYFAHPINVYDTELEKQILATLGESFPSWNVVNPNHPDHDAGYQRYAAKEGGRGMDYFFEDVLPEQDGVICMPFTDGMIGKGVFEETERILQRTQNAWLMSPDGIYQKIHELDSALCLSVDETRARVYLDRATRTLKPYC